MTQTQNYLLPDKIFSITDESLLKEKDLLNKLAAYINELINNDFQKLISLLYRADVSEKKLTSLLKDHPGDNAGNIIASLVIERQVQKIRSRQENSREENNFDEEERW